MQNHGGEDNRRIPISEIAQNLETGVAGADSLRAQGLEKLQRIRNVKTTNLLREQARLTQKLGTTHPRVLELAQKIQVNQDLKRNLDREIGRINVDIPSADENTWILHGHVLNTKLRGVPNLTMALYDQRGRWIEDLGYACTDKKGHFQMSYSTTAATENLTATIAQEGRSEQELKLFVRVLDRRSQLLYADKRPMSLKLGQVDYIRIILAEDAQSCPPPPRSPQVATEETSTPPETESPG